MHYLHKGSNVEGPFDQVALLRKVKNGSITQETLLSRDGKTPMPAGEMDELQSYFAAEDSAPSPSAGHDASQAPNFTQVLRIGISFLSDHTGITVSAGVFLLALFVLSGLVAYDFLVGFLAVALLTGPAMAAFSFYALRLFRGQTVDGGFIVSKVKSSLLHLIPTGAAMFLLPSVCVDLLLGGSGPHSAAVALIAVILSVISLFILTFFIFAPLLIVDRGMGFMAAMRASKQQVFRGGIDMISIVFGLVVMNFVGAALLILPLLVTVPVAVGGLVHLYDRFFPYEL
ncbi:MAG: DUF4339 domain-containing protein [Alphaproteobacteria bacterium]|nr:DUF4339 domain-containing protein [Alphaproteobacteria bacterium]